MPGEAPAVSLPAGVRGSWREEESQIEAGIPTAEGECVCVHVCLCLCSMGLTREGRNEFLQGGHGLSWSGIHIYLPTLCWVREAGTSGQAEGPGLEQWFSGSI